VKKKSTKSYLRLHIYLPANKTLIYNSLYVFNNWGNNLSQKYVVQLQKENVYPKDQADPDNQRSTVYLKIHYVLSRKHSQS